MDDLIGAAEADSPSADVQPTDTPNAGAQNGANGQAKAAPAPKDPPFHQHPRFQQLIGENRSLKGEVTTLRQAVEDLKRTATQPARTPEQREERAQALRVLKELQSEDPEYQELQQIRKEWAQIKQGYEGIGQVALSQQRAQVAQARSHISNLAKEAGLPGNEQYLNRLTRFIVAELRVNPEHVARFENGDLSVVTDAFQAVHKDFLGSVKREAATNVLNAKNNLQRLPPRPGAGGAAGKEAPMTLKPGDDPRAFRRQMFAKGREVLAEGAEG